MKMSKKTILVIVCNSFEARYNIFCPMPGQDTELQSRNAMLPTSLREELRLVVR